MRTTGGRRYPSNMTGNTAPPSQPGDSWFLRALQRRHEEGAGGQPQEGAKFNASY